MRLIVAYLLVGLAAATSLHKLPQRPDQLTYELGSETKHALETLKTFKARVSGVKLHHQQNQAARLLSAVQTEAVTLLLRLGHADAIPAVHEAAQALHALDDGATDVESGLQSALTEIIMVLRQLGTELDTELLEETTTAKSQIDQLLEELQVLVDTYLPIIAPFIGLTEKQAFQIRHYFDKFVADVEALEHGQVPVPEGLEAIVTDMLEILKILGIDWTAPTDDTPTDLDALLAELDSALTAVLDILGPVLGFTREQTEAIEADIDQLVADIEAIEHGHIDVDTGLEVVLQDIVDMLHDFGFKAPAPAAAGELSRLETVLEQLKAFGDKHRNAH